MEEYLPEEVILEILVRLPVKSLLRFRCVCKSWFSLISNPHFANLHFQRSSHQTHRILYIETAKYLCSKAQSVDFNASLHDDSAFVRLDLRLINTIQPYQIEIMGSCRGFLFLVLDYDSKLAIWNPSTGVCTHIPPSPSRFSAFLYGFGYDASTDDYLIVTGYYSESFRGTDIEIFSLRTNSWQKLDGDYTYVCDRVAGSLAGSLLNGAIHWLALRLGAAQVSEAAIFAFNLTKRNLLEVPMPDDFNYRPDDDFSFDSCELKVLGGCLSLTNTISHNQIGIWMMRDYGVKSSWTMHITLTLAEISAYNISPVCFTKDGQVVALYGTRLIKCNDKGELVESCLQDPPHDFDADACIYTESLLSLVSDDGENVEDRQW